MNGTLTANVGYDATGQIDICTEYGVNDPGCWDRALYAYGPDGFCGDSPHQVACSDHYGSGEGPLPEQIIFPVVANQHYYIVVDGYGTDPKSYGTFNLRIYLQP